MSRRALVLSFLSIALGALLAGLLVNFARLDVPATVKLVEGLRPDSLVPITLLLAVNGFLAAEKWRLIDRCLGHGNPPEMPRLLYFASWIGIGLGQVVPAQLSLLACRSIGAHLYGRRGLWRGTAATLFDQLFDLAIAAVAALSSVLILAGGGGAGGWLACTTVLCGTGWLTFPLTTRWAARVADWASARYPRRAAALGSSFGAPVLRAVVRRLWALSAARSLVLVLIGLATVRAATTDIPAWHIAASLPFAVIGNILAIIPGGLGVNEWAVSSALVAGTPFQSAAQWAIVNRIYVALAAVLGGIAGSVIVGLARARRATTPV